MAAPKKTTQKKKTTKSSAPAKSRSKQAGAREPRRREIGAFVCLILGVFTALAYFTTDGWLLSGLREGIGGLIGMGLWAVCPMLFAAAFILAFHRGRPVALRVAASLIVPLMVGALLHLFFCKLEFTFTIDMIKRLWTTGAASTSGGVIGGLISVGLENMVSKVGATIVMILCLIFLGLIICNRSISDIADWFKNREHLEYELEPEPEPKEPFLPLRQGKRRRPAIDIPVDDPSQAASAKPESKELFEKRPIELKKPNVKFPDEFLAGEDGSTSPTAQSDFLKKFDIPFNQDELPGIDDSPEVLDVTGAPEVAPAPASAESSVIDQQVISSKDEYKIEKIKPSDVAAESAAIQRSVEEKLAEAPPQYTFPPLTLLSKSKGRAVDGKEEVSLNAERLSAALESFGIEASITNITRGPSVTRYELELEAGVKLNKLTNLSDDLALSLGASGVRIAPIPNKISTVGIEVPNKLVSTVYLRDIIESSEFKSAQSKLTFALGKDISGGCIVGNIAKLPHLLIAGTTGSGKSVTMNSLIISVLYKARPDEVRFIMIDPKMVEFGVYNGIPHLLIPVVTDPKKAAGALQWAVTEMLKRYKAFSETGARDLASYNKTASERDLPTFPQLVVVIDELADLMLVASKEVEESICRVAQMGRASGIHLVIATQRPSADVITGLMKANIPSRIALSVSSSLESRIILDTMGAEKLVGNGDMLYSPIGQNKPIRVQGTFVSDKEREKVIDYLKESGTAKYDTSVGSFIDSAVSDDKSGGASSGGDSHGANDFDEMFGDAVNVVLELGQASVSMLQRKLKLGYSRAARLMDQLEEAGVVGPFEGSKPRQLLITQSQWQEMQSGGMPTATDTTFADIKKDDFSDLRAEGEEAD